MANRARLILQYDSAEADPEKRTIDLVLDVTQFGITLDQNGSIYLSVAGKAPRSG